MEDSRPSEPDPDVTENDELLETENPDETEEVPVSSPDETEEVAVETGRKAEKEGEGVKQKREKLKYVHLDRVKLALKEKFDTIADAYVFFDILSAGYITHAQFRRALVRLGLGSLSQEGLFQELNWRCVDGQRVFEREFFDLLQWRATDAAERTKELAGARIRREHNMKAEHNKAISLKAKNGPRPTPECDKLRGMLQGKYNSITDVMVALDMDLTDVSNPSHLRVGFKRLGITDVSVDTIFKELCEAALPLGMIRNSTFAKVVKWAPIEDLQQELIKSRLKLTHQRAKMDVTTLPAVPTTTREGPAITAFRRLLAKYFGSVVDAFVFFDLDCAAELNRSKLLHGLARMKQFSADDDTAVVGEELVREFRLGKESYISVSEFILRMKWHKAPYGSDLDKVVFDARKRMQSSIMSQTSSHTTTKPHPPKKKRNHNHRSSPRPMAHGRAGSTEAAQSPYTQRFSSDEKSPRSPRTEPAAAEEAALPESDKADARAEETKTEEESATEPAQAEDGATEESGEAGASNRESEETSAEPVASAENAANAENAENASENADSGPGPEEQDVTANGNAEEVMQATDDTVQDRPPAQAELEAMKDAEAPSPRGQALRKSKQDGKLNSTEQRKGWDQGTTHSEELAWLDDKIKKTLQLDLSASRLGRGQLWAWDAHPKAAPKKAAPRKAARTARRNDGVVKQLVRELRERGLPDMVDAYVFFDAEGGGQMTPSQMQRGLVSLRIFQISVHQLPFKHAAGPSLVPTVGLAQFVSMLAPVDADAGALSKLPDQELTARWQDARARRSEIVKAALGAVGSVTDRQMEDLRTRIMHGLSVQAPDAPPQTDEEARGVPASELRVSDHSASAAPANADAEGGTDPAADFPTSETKGDEEEKVEIGSLEDVSSPATLPQAQDQAESGGARGVPEANGDADSAPGGRKGKMSYARESCVLLEEHSAAASQQGLCKPPELESAGRSTQSAGGGPQATPPTKEAAQGTSRYMHARHRGVAFRLSSEAGESPGSVRAPLAEERAGWTGQRLFRALCEDGSGELELESIVGRLQKLGLQRERTSMLVTRLCEQQPGRDASEESCIGEDDLVQAFEGMELEWQSETPLAAPASLHRSPLLSPRRRSRSRGGAPQTADAAREAEEGRWAGFDEGLDEEAEAPEVGIRATLHAQQVTEAEQFVRLDLGQGNWFEGQASKRGLPHGSGLLVLAPGDEAGRRWQLGTFVKGKLNGAGVMMNWDGSFYLGDFKDGRRHGAGVDGLVNAVVYEGEFRDGRKDGVGCLWVETGPSFFGEWVLGERHGRGITGSCNKLWLRKSSATWPKEGEDAAASPGRAALPHSEIRTAIKFEEWVYVSTGKVTSASRNLPQRDREQMLEALLWNAAQARTAACEGWSQGQAILHRMDKFMQMREKIARTAAVEKANEKGRTSKGSTTGADGNAGLKRVLLPVADKFKRKEPPFVIPRIPIFNTITRHKPA